jgi:hypothetical protein
MEKEIKEGEITQAIDSQMPDLGPIYYCKLIEKITENEWIAEASMSMPFSPLGRVKIAYCEENWAVISFF